MKIGYYVQGSTDEAVVRGLSARWCPNAELAAGKFRGSSKLSFRREIANALFDLRDDKHCDVLVVLTDSDANAWREVKRREWERIPVECQHLVVFGVAERNIECWLSLDRGALAAEIGCKPQDLLVEDPKGIVESGFGYGRQDVEDVQMRISRFVQASTIRNWIKGKSFEDFYDDVRGLAAQTGCSVPNEREIDG
ncbi:MAG TPA: hypothetical protein VMV10_08865 [Pirellulales bacterium]|nr:hypothetical protein [Pirellulales bacterium]